MCLCASVPTGNLDFDRFDCPYVDADNEADNTPLTALKEIAKKP